MRVIKTSRVTSTELWRYKAIEAEGSIDDATALIDDIIRIAYGLKLSMMYRVIYHIERGPSFCCYSIKIPAGRAVKLYADLTPLAKAVLKHNEFNFKSENS